MTAMASHCFSPSTSIDSFSSLRFTWNKNDELVRILEAARDHPQWLTHSVYSRPNNGTQLFFARKDGTYFKADGYEWGRRKDRRLMREDHMKLKVNKVDVIAANYAHSAVLPSFHRRVYWLISNPEIVFVHYLKSETEDEEEGGVNAYKIADSLGRNGLHLSLQQLKEQLQPILCRQSPQEVHALCQEVLSKMGECKLNRRNSCSSASRRGLSSIVLARQASAFSDSVDTHLMGGMDSRCREESIEYRNNVCCHERAESGHSRSQSGETTRSSEEAVPPSEWSRQDGYSGDWSTGQSLSQWSLVGKTTNSLDVCPSVASVTGGERILVVGGWYLRGHEYHVHFGDRRVKARLLQVGVLETTTPPATRPGRVSVRVSVDGVITNNPAEFTYKEEIKGEPRSVLLQALVDRLHLVASAFGVALKLSSVDECSVLRVLCSLRGRSLLHPFLLSSSFSSFSSRTLLHLAAALDSKHIIEFLLFWRTELPPIRELDLNARDFEGRTPLQVALAYRHESAATALAVASGSSMEELERETDEMDRRRNGMNGEGREEERGEGTGWNIEEEGEVHARSTALWVNSDGERIIEDERNGGNDGESLYSHRSVPLEISMDTNVLVPDSPLMAHLFHAVTSPGVVDDCTRDKMARLARQLVDAMPHTVKTTPTSPCGMRGEMGVAREDTYPSLHSSLPLSHNSFPPPSFSYQSYYTDQLDFPLGEEEVPPFLLDNPSTLSSSDDDNSILQLDLDFGEKELCEFFSTVDISSTDVDPLQKKLENLKLNVQEQRDVYEAAMAMLEHRTFEGEGPTERERTAALAIQDCYRRYKQFCYLRRLHNAAVVVQKHFRLRRTNQKEETSDQVQEHPSMQGESICIQVPTGSLREQRAATTIQTAYRVHRKRHAAARLIQRFMRQTRQNNHSDDMVTPEDARSKRRCVYGCESMRRRPHNIWK